MADLTTLGVTFHYGVETAKGTKPTAFTWLKRCNSIGGISLDTEQIDVSALEDFITQYASGRQDTGGTWDVTFNLNADVITALKKLMSDAATGKTKGFRVWFEVVFPDLEDAFFVIADPGKNIPLSPKNIGSGPNVRRNPILTIALWLILSNSYTLVNALLPDVKQFT